MKKKGLFKRIISLQMACFMLVSVIGGAMPAFAATVDTLTIADGTFSVKLDANFPTAREYAVGSDTFAGRTQGNGTVFVNGEEQTINSKTVTPVGIHKVAYELNLSNNYELTVEMQAVATQTGGELQLRYLDISDNVKTFEIKGHGLLQADSATKASFNRQYYREDTVEQAGNEVAAANNLGLVFLSKGNLAAAVETCMFGQTMVASKNGADTLFSSNEVIYRGEDNKVTEEPWTKVAITKDLNSDNKADWQDAAVAYRAIMDEMPGDQLLARQSTYVQVGLNYRNKFPRPFELVIDNAKRLANATDGFPQIIEMKNAHEGFDGWPSYGEASKALGGQNALTWMMEAGKEIGAHIGLHADYTSAYPESPFYVTINEYDQQRFAETGNWNDSIFPRDASGKIIFNASWHCMDQQTAFLRENKNYKAGLLNEFQQKNADAYPDLGFQYVDIKLGDDAWSALTTVQQFKKHGWNLGCEYSSGHTGHSDTSLVRGARYISWVHNFGASTNSALRRFVLDNYVITGNTSSGGDIADLDKVIGFGDTTKNSMWGAHGWANNNNQETIEEQIDIFWRQILPDTFLKNYQIQGYTRSGNDMTATFAQNPNTPELDDSIVRVEWKDAEGLRYMYKNDVLIGKVSRGQFGERGHAYYDPRYSSIGQAQLFIPYADDAQNYDFPAYREDKIYTHSDKAESVTWQLPTGENWKNLANVMLYELDETDGRKNGVSLPVTNGKITINYTNTINGYVVYPGEAAPNATIWGDSNGLQNHVRDFEFNSNLGGATPWAKGGDVTVEQDPLVQLRYSPAGSWNASEPNTGYTGSLSEVNTSNRFVRFNTENEGSLSQTITGLIPGASYVFSAFVDVKNTEGQTKTGILQVADDADGTNAVSVSSQNYKVGSPSYERLNGWEMVRVYYTANASGTAVVTVKGSAGAGDISIDSVRDYPEESPYGRDGSYFKAIFDQDHWLGGFVHARYVEDYGQTLTLESKDALDVIYTLPDGTKTIHPTDEILNDTVREQSLKLRPAPGTAPILTTLPGLVTLKANTEYIITLDYTSELGSSNSGPFNWTMDVYSPSADKVIGTFPLAGESGVVSLLKETFNTGDYSDCVIRITKGSNSDLVIDNLAISDDSSLLTKYTVTASCNEFGTVEPATKSVLAGGTAIFTFTANEGYGLKTVTVDGVETAFVGNSVTIPNVTADMTVVGTFSASAPLMEEKLFTQQDSDIPGLVKFPWRDGSTDPNAGIPLAVPAGGTYNINLNGSDAHTIRITYINANSASGSFINMYTTDPTKVQKLIIPNDTPDWRTTKVVDIPLDEIISKDTTTISFTNGGDKGGVLTKFTLVGWDNGSIYFAPPANEPSSSSSIPTSSSSIPTSSSSIPVSSSSIPTSSSSIPTSSSSIPTSSSSIPASSSSIPTSSSSIPTSSSSIPTSSSSIPASSSVSTAPESVSTPSSVVTLFAPESTIPESVSTAPESVPAPPSSVPAPVSSVPAPVSSVPAPASSVPAPASSVPAPASSVPAPASSETTIPETELVPAEVLQAPKLLEEVPEKLMTEQEKASLSLTIAYAKTLDSALYKAITFDAMNVLLAKAEAVLADATAKISTGAAADARLARSITYLEKRADPTALNAVVAMAKPFVSDTAYTAKTRADLQAQLNAVPTDINSNISEARFNEWFNAIAKALNSLAQVQLLQDRYDARTTKQGDYPNDLWAAYSTSVTHLKEAIAYTNLTVLDVYLLTESYDIAYNSLFEDTTPPAIANDVITLGGTTDKQVLLKWNFASDNLGVSNLNYTIYTGATEQSVTGKAMESATIVNVGGNLNINTLLLTKLVPQTTYWFNIKVTDKAGNGAYYKAVKVVTEKEKPIDNTAPVIADGSLTGSDISTRSFTLSWNKATDAATAQELIAYNIYVSDKAENVASIEAMLANATKLNAMSIFGTEQYKATALHKNTTYYYNIIATDSSNNSSMYTPNKLTTTSVPSVPDTLEPTVQNSGILFSAQKGDLKLSWKAATDNAYEDEDLNYFVYYGKKDITEDQMNTIENVEQYGTLLNAGGNKNITSYVVSKSIIGDDKHWYNIIVTDGAGNKNIYTRSLSSIPTVYLVSFEGVGVGGSTDETHSIGDEISIDAGTKEGYMFKEWTANYGTFTDKTDATTMFTVPAQAAEQTIVITANWTKIMPDPVVKSVSVTPNAADVTKGNTQAFTAKVTIENNVNNVLSEAVTWSVGRATDSVISADGILSVGLNETATTITVCATSTADTSISGTVQVSIKEKAPDPKPDPDPDPNTGDSDVVQKPGAPVVTVKGLQDLYKKENLVTDNSKGITAADMEVLSKGGKVHLKLIIEPKTAAQLAEQTQLLKKLTGNKSLFLLDISVVKEVTPLNGSTTSTTLSSLPKILQIEVEIPAALRNKSNLGIVRVHNGVAQALAVSDGTKEGYAINGNYITIYASDFSTYALAYNETPTVPTTPTTPDAPKANPKTIVQVAQTVTTAIQIVLALTAASVLMTAGVIYFKKRKANNK